MSSWLRLQYHFKCSAVSLSRVKLSSLLLHDLHFSYLAPSARKSHPRRPPAGWKLGSSFLARFLLAGGGGGGCFGGNVTELKSKLSRCKAWCSGVGNDSQLSFLPTPSCNLQPGQGCSALHIRMAVVTDEILCVDSMFVSPPQLKKMWLDSSPAK